MQISDTSPRSPANRSLHRLVGGVGLAGMSGGRFAMPRPGHGFGALSMAGEVGADLCGFEDTEFIGEGEGLAPPITTLVSASPNTAEASHQSSPPWPNGESTTSPPTQTQ